MNEHEDSFGAIANGHKIRWLVIAIVSAAGKSLAWPFGLWPTGNRRWSAILTAQTVRGGFNHQPDAGTTERCDLQAERHDHGAGSGPGASTGLKAQEQKPRNRGDKKTTAGAARTRAKRASVTDKALQNNCKSQTRRATEGN